MEIKIRKTDDAARLPERGSAYAAGYDLFANLKENMSLKPGESKLVPTGIQMALPDGYFGGVFARSGLSLKEGLRPANCVGVIDSDYRGEVFVSLHNDSETERTVTDGQKIAQLVVLPFLPLEFELVDELDDTKRGEGGFGSTGK